MNLKFGIDIYILICIKWITNKNLLYKKINKIKFKKKLHLKSWANINFLTHSIGRTE